MPECHSNGWCGTDYKCSMYPDRSECPYIHPETILCKDCGGKVCICEFEGGAWAAHCMSCDNSIGARGYYDPCAFTEEQAGAMWMKLNTKET